MGSHVTKPSNKSMVDRLVERSCFIHTPEIEGVFRAVDRAMYFEIEEGDPIDPYEDDPWKRGNLHISAPCIYARVVGALKLESGLSFLNMGSGTGYLNTLIGLLIGPNGINHGIELHGDVVEYAYRKLEQFKSKSRALDKYDFAEPFFIKGNCLNLNPNLRYDRIYLGAACLLDMEESIKRLVKPNGGILVMPFGNRLMRHTRVSETEWKSESLMDVNFTQMIGQGEDTAMIDMPKSSAKSLKELCRIAIRQHLREKTDILYPNLLNSDNIDHRRARQMRASKMMLKAKKPSATTAASSESNNNICSMSSSSSMNRIDKRSCHCRRDIHTRNQRVVVGDNNSNNNVNNSSSSRMSSQSSSIDRDAVANSTSSNSGSVPIVEGDANQDQETAATSSGRIMTRSASKLLQQNTNNNTGNTSGSSSSGNSYNTQTSSSRSCSQDASRLTARPSSNAFRSSATTTSIRKHIISSSESTAGNSSSCDDDDDDDDDDNDDNNNYDNEDDNNANDNNLNNLLGSRGAQSSARTRPFRATRSGNRTDALSGIFLGAFPRGSQQRRQQQHQARRLRWATLSGPDESDSMSDSDTNISPMREPWCVARQLRTHRARFLHLQGTGNSNSNNSTGRVNIGANPSSSEYSLRGLAELILGDECVSSGDDSWDNSSSSSSTSSDQSSRSFSIHDEDDDDEDDEASGTARRNFCSTISGLRVDVGGDVYHDDADDIDGILEDSIHVNTVAYDSQSSSPSSHNEFEDNLEDNEPRQGTSSGGSVGVSKSLIADEPVARRLRSRGSNLPINMNLSTKHTSQQSTSENPESSASSRISDQDTPGDVCLDTSLGARLTGLMPSTSNLPASVPFQFRCPKYTGKKTSHISDNHTRLNHRNHRHCRRHCKEAQCQTANSMQASTSSQRMQSTSTEADESPSASSHVASTSATVDDLILSPSDDSTQTRHNASTAADKKPSLSHILDRKRKRQSSSESSEVSNETSPCWHPTSTTSRRQSTSGQGSKRVPRRMSSRQTRCLSSHSCSRRSHQQLPQQQPASSRLSLATADQDGEGTFIVMSNALSHPPAASEDNERSSAADEDQPQRSSSSTGPARSPFRTRFLLHNTWSDMLHRQLSTLDVLTRLHATSPSNQSRMQPQPPTSSASAASRVCFWSQLASPLNNQAQRHRSNVNRAGLMSSTSSSSNIGSRSSRSSGLRSSGTPQSSALEPSDGGNSSSVAQHSIQRQRVNCCCCRYCRNVRRSRRERKQQLHHQSKRSEDTAESRHRCSRRRGRRRRDNESEKYYNHMSGYIRQLPIPCVLHNYLNYDRAF